MTPITRFTIGHSSLSGGSLVVENPIGWKEVVLSLERDKDYHSLVEYFKGNFMWYGEGMKALKQIETDYGINAVVTLTIDVSFKTDVYTNLFQGTIKLPQLEEIIIADREHYKMTAPIIKDDFWTKFINRIESDVNLEAAVDLDGDARTAINKIVLPMPSQKMRLAFSGALTEDLNILLDGTSPYYFSQITSTSDDDGWSLDNVMQLTVNPGALDEILDRYNLPTLQYGGFNVLIPLPTPTFKAKYSGSYNFQSLRFTTFGFDSAGGIANETQASLQQKYFNTSSTLEVCLKVGSVEYILTPTDYSSILGTRPYINGSNPALTDITCRWTVWEYTGGAIDISLGDEITFYARILNLNPGSVAGATHGYAVLGNGNSNHDIVVSPGWVEFAPLLTDPASECELTADTVYEDTSTDAYLIKDAAESIVSKIVGQNAAVKSDYLDTEKGYNAIFRGKHLRGYDFSTKQFSMNFKEWWEGANPLLFLGLGYTEVAGIKKVEIENRAFFYNATPVVNISNVNNLVRRYDLEKIYKQIEIGYKKWSSESSSGIDDPQSKRVFNTDFKSIGVNEKISCEWMAASLAIERSRRNRVELGKDDRNDEEIMVVALVEDGSDWLPEFGTVFNAVTNLLNSDFRINIRHSATRLFKRWQAWFNGCMVYSDTGEFTFNRGEGNYEMTSQFETTDYEATDDPEPVLDEGADIVADTDNIIFVPKIYEASDVPMSLDTYQDIVANRNNALGLSRTAVNHIPMHVLNLDFAMFESKATILLLQATNENL